MKDKASKHQRLAIHEECLISWTYFYYKNKNEISGGVLKWQNQ
jgi:hypothetical protein